MEGKMETIFYKEKLFSIYLDIKINNLFLISKS